MIMIQNLIKNWKTTSAGLTLIVGSVVHLVFAFHTADEATWTASITAILGGLGLIFAGDANVPSATSVQTAQAVDQINQQGPNPTAPAIAPTVTKT